MNPRSKGLYHGVILESGAFADWNAITMDCAEGTYQQLLLHTNCDDLTCLLEKDALAIKRASERGIAEATAKGCAYAPVVDGIELTTHPWIALSNGDVADVPILLGTNSDEGAIFTALSHDADATQLNSYWSEVMGYDAATIDILTDLYVTNKTYDTSFATTYWWAAERAYGDNMMSCPSEYAAQELGAYLAQGTRRSSVYFYHFEHLPRVKDVLTRHVCEIPYVFHQKELLGHEDDMRMADVLSSWWANFFATGNPNNGAIGLNKVPYWKDYVVASDNVLVIETASAISTTLHLKQEKCAFFIPYLNDEIRSEYVE